MTTSVVYPAQTGSVTQFAIPFEYLVPGFVKVTVDGVETSFTFASKYMAQISPAPSGDVRIYRDSRTDTPLIVFTDGSVLIDDDLNASTIQALHIAEETRDASLELSSGGTWDFQNLRQTSVADPVDATDGVNKGWVETAGNTALADTLAAKSSVDSTADQVTADAAQVSSDKDQVAADSAQVSSDKAQVASDAAQVALDRAQVASDAAQVALDKASVEASETQVASDAAQVASDKSDAEAAASTATTKADEAAASATLAATFDPNDYLAKASADMAGNGITNLLSLNGGPLSGLRNALINGNFDVWKRSTVQTVSGYGSDDRWQNNNPGHTSSNQRQPFAEGQTDVPGNPKYYARTHITVAASGANNHVAKYQPIEGVRTFAGQLVTLTFYAKADAARDIVIEFAQAFGTGGSPSASRVGQNITRLSLTTSWQRFDVVVTIPDIIGETIGTNGNDLLGMIIWMSADAASMGTRNDNLGVQTGIFDFARFSLVKGDTSQEADPYGDRTPDTEELLCLRFYREFIGDLSNMQFVNTSTTRLGQIRMSPPMRETPSRVISGGELVTLVNSNRLSANSESVIHYEYTVAHIGHYGYTNVYLEAELY